MVSGVRVYFIGHEFDVHSELSVVSSVLPPEKKLLVLSIFLTFETISRYFSLVMLS